MIPFIAAELLLLLDLRTTSPLVSGLVGTELAHSFATTTTWAAVGEAGTEKHTSSGELIIRSLLAVEPAAELEV